MTTTSLQKPIRTASSGTAARPASGRWILNLWSDLLLFVATPLLIVPLVFLLQSPWVGVEAKTIGILVFSFGALGHHLPGMIRAYGDRELFRRFRARFLVAPVLLLAVAIPVAQYHLHTLTLVILIWGCWHGLMQLYGFARIYDAKVGSISPVTAYWDWLLCACWFATAQVFSTSKMSDFLELWYTSGGPLIPPAYVQLFRWVCLAISIVVLIGFLANHALQTYRGRIEQRADPQFHQALAVGQRHRLLVVCDGVRRECDFGRRPVRDLPRRAVPGDRVAVQLPPRECDGRPRRIYEVHVPSRPGNVVAVRRSRVRLRDLWLPA